MGSLRSLRRKEVLITPPTDEELIQAIQFGTFKQVKTLLAKGANPNAMDETFSALQIAVCREHVGMTRLLVRFGADVTRKTKLGSTALHLAVLANGRKARRIGGILLDNGADINAADFVEWTPLMEASFDNKFAIAKLLLERGADATLRDVSEKRAVDILEIGRGNRNKGLRKLLKEVS